MAMVPVDLLTNIRLRSPGQHLNDSVQVVMLRVVNVGHFLGFSARLGTGEVVELPPDEADAWCAAGWAGSELAQQPAPQVPRGILA